MMVVHGECPKGEYWNTVIFSTPRCLACRDLCAVEVKPTDPTDTCCWTWFKTCRNGLLPKFAETMCNAKSPDESNLFVMVGVPVIVIIAVVGIVALIIIYLRCRKKRGNDPTATQPTPDNVEDAAGELQRLNVNGQQANGHPSAEIEHESDPTATGPSPDNGENAAGVRQSLLGDGHAANGQPGAVTGSSNNPTGPRLDNGDGAAGERQSLLSNDHQADDCSIAVMESMNNSTQPTLDDNEDDSEEQQSLNSHVFQTEDPPVVIAQCSNGPTQGRSNEADPQPGGDDDGHHAVRHPVAVRPQLEVDGS